MTKKILAGVGIVLALLVVYDTYRLIAAPTKLGASSNINSINLVPSATPGGDTYGLAINGTTLVDLTGDISANGTLSGTALTINGGTQVKAQNCATSSITFGSTAMNATGTVQFALTGATSSLNQVYFVSLATTSANLVSFQAHPSSTTGNVVITYQNLGGTWNVATTSVSVCYTQF